MCLSVLYCIASYPSIQNNITIHCITAYHIQSINHNILFTFIIIILIIIDIITVIVIIMLCYVMLCYYYDYYY